MHALKEINAQTSEKGLSNIEEQERKGILIVETLGSALNQPNMLTATFTNTFHLCLRKSEEGTKTRGSLFHLNEVNKGVSPQDPFPSSYGGFDLMTKSALPHDFCQLVMKMRRR